MRPELGPPDVEVIDYPAEDASWAAEWLHFRARSRPGKRLGDLDSAAYAWSCVEAAYELMPLISVVIPAYNEEANVGRVYERLRRCSPRCPSSGS